MSYWFYYLSGASSKQSTATTHMLSATISSDMNLAGSLAQTHTLSATISSDMSLSGNLTIDIDTTSDPNYVQETYEIKIINHRTGELIEVLEPRQLQALTYSRILNGIGKIAMVMDYTTHRASTYQLDDFVEIYRRTKNGKERILEETYLIRMKHRYIDGNVTWFGIGGVSLNHLLKRRIIDPNDDPSAAGGYSTKAGEGTQVLYDYANEQIGQGASSERRIPGLRIRRTGEGNNIGGRFRHDSLLKVFQDLQVQSGVDFAIRRGEGTDLELFIGKLGTDRSISANYPMLPYTTLSPHLANLVNPSLRVDRIREQNFVYATGEGKGSNQTVLTIAGPGITDSAYNRIEFQRSIRKAKKDDDSTYMLTLAGDELAKRSSQIEFEFEVSGDLAGAIYREDWDVGDHLTIAWDDHIEDLRVIEAEISIRGDSEVISAKIERVEI